MADMRWPPQVWLNWQYIGRINLSQIPDDAFITPLRPGWIPWVWRVLINRGEYVLWIVGPLRILWTQKQEPRRG